MNYSRMFKLLATIGYKRCIVSLVLASILIPIGMRPTYKTTQSTATRSPISKQNTTQSTKSTSSSTVANVILPRSFHVGLRLRNVTFNCITARLIGMKFPICVYPAASDTPISRMLMRGAYYEREQVSQVFRLLQLDRRLQFVDIGANIGVFSLPIARLTQVLAVEPNVRSMARLARAVDLGGISSNITLVHNAISDVRTKFKLDVNKVNQGKAILFPTNLKGCISTYGELQPCTSSVLLNDLLPHMRSTAALLKVDVVSHEFKVFTEWSAGHFFDKIDVPVVFMECLPRTTFTPQFFIEPLLNFFHKRNYVAFDTSNYFRLEKDCRQLPKNIMFKKLSYRNYTI